MGDLVLFSPQAPDGVDPEHYAFDTTLRRACRDGGLKLPPYKRFDDIPLDRLGVADSRPVGVESLLENGVPEPKARRVVLLCGALSDAAFVVAAASRSRARGPARAAEERQAARARAAVATIARECSGEMFLIAADKAEQGYGALVAHMAPYGMHSMLLSAASVARSVLPVTVRGLLPAK